jgi:hypothetical protein
MGHRCCPPCNAPESKRLRSTLHAERTTLTTIPLTLSSSLRIKGLTHRWLDGLYKPYMLVYTSNKPHVSTPDPHAPVAAKVSSDIICNTLESKQFRSTLHVERTTPTTIPLTISSSLRVKELTQRWWDRL